MQADEGFRLSTQQKHLWLSQRGGPAFRSLCAILLEGDLDRVALEESLRRTVERHEILRTSFYTPSGVDVPFQVIGESAAPDFRESAPGAGSREGAPAELDERFEAARREPFDFQSASPASFTLLTLAERRAVLLVSLPALCADTASLFILSDEIARSYEAVVRGGALDDEPVQYVDFADWQHELS